MTPFLPKIRHIQPKGITPDIKAEQARIKCRVECWGGSNCPHCSKQPLCQRDEDLVKEYKEKMEIEIDKERGELIDGIK